MFYEFSISQSPYSVDVKRSIYMVVYSSYYENVGETEVDIVSNAEDFVIENGIFLGAQSKNGFFMCETEYDVLHSFWLTGVTDWDKDYYPGKVFLKKMGELYEEATKIYI